MRPRLQPWLIAVSLFGILLWSYWTTLLEMNERWFNDPQYQHGYLVPLFSLFLLWWRRPLLKHQTLSPSWWGVAVLLGGLACRAAGAYFFYGYFDTISLLICLAGLALAVGGLDALRWSWPAILFLGFMVPLPFRFQIAFAGSLQDMATLLSTYLLQTVGVPAVADGRIILINDTKIGVIEACSGLGNLVAFLAISTGIAMVLVQGWWRKAALIVCAIPVAIMVNVLRIMATGILFDFAQDKLAREVFHEYAGILMIPLGFVFIMVELFILNRLVVDRSHQDHHFKHVLKRKETAASSS